VTDLSGDILLFKCDRIIDLVSIVLSELSF